MFLICLFLFFLLLWNGILLCNLEYPWTSEPLAMQAGFDLVIPASQVLGFQTWTVLSGFLLYSIGCLWLELWVRKGNKAEEFSKWYDNVFPSARHCSNSLTYINLININNYLIKEEMLVSLSQIQARCKAISSFCEWWLVVLFVCLFDILRQYFSV